MAPHCIRAKWLDYRSIQRESNLPKSRNLFLNKLIIEPKWLIINGVLCSHLGLIPQVSKTLLTSDLLCENRIGLVANEPRCIMLIFPTRMFCRDIAGFVNGCPCGIWRRTTRLLYVGPLCGDDILNKLVINFVRKEISLSPWYWLILTIILICESTFQYYFSFCYCYFLLTTSVQVDLNTLYIYFA